MRLLHPLLFFCLSVMLIADAMAEERVYQDPADFVAATPGGSIVFGGQFMVALCFAEMAGQYPLAGSVYNWYVVAKNSAGSTPGPAWRFTVKSKGK